MSPLTGKPDAGKLPVRFGGRGKVNPLFLPLSLFHLHGSGFRKIARKDALRRIRPALETASATPLYKIFLR